MLRTASQAAARSLTQLRPPTASTLGATRAYHENIVEHYESPRNVGSLPKDDEDVGTGESGVGPVKGAKVSKDVPFLLLSHLTNPFQSPLFMIFLGLVGAPACGDVMKLQIRVNDDGTIEESKFKTFGCGSAIASSSVATEWIQGKSIDEVVKIKNTDIAAHLKLPPVKLHCSMLAEDAIKAAVNDWKAKQEKKKQQSEAA